MDSPRLALRRLGRTDLHVTPIGFGAFKIGRNEGIKYALGYDLPTDAESDRLLLGVVDELGIRYIDTAPAYGLSEERVGRALGSRKDVVISTKVGESFERGVSQFDFTDAGVRRSVARSLQRLRRDALDIVFVHSSGDDLSIQRSEDVVSTLRELKSKGDIRAIGFSGKTVDGALAAIDVARGTAWADVLMVEYNLVDQSHENVIREANAHDVGVVIKKGLASGALPPREAVQFILRNRGVSSMVIGGMNLDHVRSNVRSALESGFCG